MAGVVITFFLLGILAITFYTPYCMAKGVQIIAYSDLSKSEKLKCMIPIYNVVNAETLYTGEFNWTLTSIGAFIATLVFRLLVVFLEGSKVVQIISIILVLITMLGVYIANVRLVYMVIKDAEVKSAAGALLFAIILPYGQYYIGTFMPTVVKNLAKQEETFK